MTRDDQILLLLNNITKLLEDRTGFLSRVEYKERHDQLQISHTALQQRVEGIDQRLAKQEEKGRVMEDDIKEIKTDLKQTREELLKNQRQGFQRTIALQGAILLAIITALIAYFFQFLPHH